MKFNQLNIEEFLCDLSSEKPSPGGGSVAALLAALASSLNSMVYSLTINKKSFGSLDNEIQKTVLDFKEASNKFTKISLDFMEQDREAFTKLMDCFKMPKETDEEKEARSKAILEKTIKALEVPLNLARNCYEFYDNIDTALKYGNKMLASDASCAAILLHSAIESAIVNVKVNLNNCSSKNFKEKIETEIENIEFNSFSRKNIVCNMAEEVFYPESAL